jgi:hypothetical protein
MLTRGEEVISLDVGLVTPPKEKFPPFKKILFPLIASIAKKNPNQGEG